MMQIEIGFRTDQQERTRLGGHNLQIFNLLRKGPATNRDLAEISLKYTSRISDVRAFLAAEIPRWEVVCVKGKGGLNTYKLQEQEQ